MTKVYSGAESAWGARRERAKQGQTGRELYMSDGNRERD